MTKVFKHPKDMLSAVDTEIEATDWMEIDQARVDRFADATDDHQWIHVDPERAAEGPFGSCIAHGMLTLSLANKFLPELIEVEQVTMGINYGADRVRYPNMVKVGQRIRGRGRIISAEEKPSGVQVVTRVTIEVEDQERPACVVDTISRYYYEE